MGMKRHFGLLGAAVALLAAIEAHAAGNLAILQNDGWEGAGDPVAFQNGFVSGEIAATRLHPTLPCPCRVLELQFLFGGASGTRPATIRVWDDGNGALDPGSARLTKSVEIDPSSSSLYTLDLRSIDLDVNSPFRVGIEFSAAGLPSAAIDQDGTINDARNFVFSDGKWWKASDFDLDGDWIIRAEIESEVATCGQPVTFGDLPAASDALYILRTAVGQARCSPCVCDTDASGATTASDALRCLKAAVGQEIQLQCLCD